MQAINFKHGGGGNSCCWDRYAFFPTKARSPCFNVKVMHIVVQQPFQAFCMIYTEQNSMYLTENPESSTSYKDSTVNVYIVVNEWMLHFIQNEIS